MKWILLAIIAILTSTATNVGVGSPIPIEKQPQSGVVLSASNLFPEGAEFGKSRVLLIDNAGNISTEGTASLGDVRVGGTAFVDTLNLSGILYVAGNNIIDATGRIPELTIDYISDLDGSAITDVDAATLDGIKSSGYIRTGTDLDADELDGKDSGSFLRSDAPDAAGGPITFTATPGSSTVGGGPAYINPSSSIAGRTLFGISLNNLQRFKVDAEGDVEIAGDLTVTGNLSGTFDTNFSTGSVLFQGSSGLLEDNDYFFWDSGNNRLGIGTTAPGTPLEVRGTTSDGTAAAFSVTAANGTNRLYVRNDGKTAVGTGWVSLYSNYGEADLTIIGSGGTADLVFLSASGPQAAQIGLNEGTNEFTFDSCCGNKLRMDGVTSPFYEFDTPDKTSAVSIATGGFLGIHDQTPDALLDYDLISIGTTGASEYGSFFTVNDTGVVTTGTDTTYGNYNTVTRTGATGGTINTYGEYINLVTDNAGSGTSTAYGLFVDLDGNADTNYAGIFSGGNVGIGTSSPVSLLELSDSSNNGGGGITLAAGGITAKSAFLPLNVSGELISFFGSNVYADSSLVTQRFDTSQLGWVFAFDNRASQDLFKLERVSDVGTLTRPLIVLGDGSFGFGDLTSPASFEGAKLMMDSSGNVSIGATAPAAGMMLDVAGLVQINLGGTQTSVALCGSHSGGGGPSFSDVEIVDCTGTPGADYMEMYPVEAGVEAGDVVVVGSETVTTTDGSTIKQLIKSSVEYQENIIGIVSDIKKAGDFNSIGYNINAEDNPTPVALSGRVPVKIAGYSNEIHPGDFITASNVPGKAMKAISAGLVIGKALDSWIPGSGKETIMIFVNNSYYLGVNFVIDPDTGAFLAISTTEPNATAPEEQIVEEQEEDTGIFQIVKNLIIEGIATFKNAVKFLSTVTFSEMVKFEKRTEFADRDLAGYAKMKPGTNKIQVKFENEYTFKPAVQITPQGKYDIQYWISDVSTKGFTIRTDPAVDDEVKFSWLVIAVEDAKTHKNEGEDSVSVPTVEQEEIIQEVIESSASVDLPEVDESTSSTQ